MDAKKIQMNEIDWNKSHKLKIIMITVEAKCFWRAFATPTEKGYPARTVLWVNYFKPSKDYILMWYKLFQMLEKTLNLSN